MTANSRRIAFVVNALTGKELAAGNRDSSRIYTLLTDPHLGMCSPESSPPPLHGCRNARQFSAELAKVLRSWNSNDQFLFYFSGHGVVRHGFFCLEFGRSSVSHLPFSNLWNDLSIAGVTRAVIILDACHSGGALRKGQASEETAIHLPQDLPQGIAVLASSRVSQPSFELPDRSASVFTNLICDGIETGLDGTTTSDGYIGVADLIDYVRDALKNPRYSQFLQEPTYQINQANREIWVAKNKSGETASNSASQAPEVVRISTLDELRLAYEHVIQARHPCAGATLADLDWALVRNYAFRAGVAFAGADVDEDLIAEMGLFSPLSRSEPKALHNAAVLCFCKRPEKFIPQARSIFLAGELGGDRFVQQHVTGPLSRQVEELVRLTMENLGGTVALFGRGGLREDDSEIPDRVVRELISNALAHRDYQAPGTVQVWVNARALEVQSPGSFPGNTTWETFLKGGRVSCPVDPAITLYLAKLQAVEGIGRGFSVFRNYIEKNGDGSMTCQEGPGPTTLIRTIRPELVHSRRERLRILYVAANPLDTARLRLDEEIREISTKLRASELRDVFELVAQWSLRASDLQEGLLRHKPHVVHFSGMGTGSEKIFFSDDQGLSKPARNSVLAALFGILKDNIRVVVLDRCYSEPQAQSLAQHIDCVIGIKSTMGDGALVFATAFYRALAYGRSVRDAFDLGINEVALSGIRSKVPVLLVRKNVDPAEVKLLL